MNGVTSYTHTANVKFNDVYLLDSRDPVDGPQNIELLVRIIDINTLVNPFVNS